MNEYDRQARIHQLQDHRRALLQQRDRRGAPIATIDMELNVIRSELQALYETGRVLRQTHAPRNAANHARIA